MEIASMVVENIAERMIGNVTVKKDNIFTKAYTLIKMILGDPEGVELHAFVHEGELNVDVLPDRLNNKHGLRLKLSTFMKED